MFLHTHKYCYIYFSESHLCCLALMNSAARAQFTYIIYSHSSRQQPWMSWDRDFLSKQFERVDRSSPESLMLKTRFTFLTKDRCCSHSWCRLQPQPFITPEWWQTLKHVPQLTLSQSTLQVGAVMVRCNIKQVQGWPPFEGLSVPPSRTAEGERW